VSSTFLTLVVVPVLYRWFEGREPDSPSPQEQADTALLTH
jgi:hypothetical protein